MRREAQQGEAGIRRSARFRAPAVRLFGFFEIAAQAVQLGELIQRRAECRLTRWFGQALAREQRLVERLPPYALQRNDFRTMNEAFSPIRHHVGLRGAPPRQRVRPLASASDIRQVPARREHAAVNDAGNDRRYLTGRNRNHHLIEQPDPAFDVAKLDKRSAEALPRQVGQIDIAESLADPGRFRELRAGVVDVGRHQRLPRCRQQQMAALGARLAAFIQQPRGTGDPARCLCGVSGRHRNRRDPRGDTASLPELSAVDEALLRANQRRETFRVLANQVGRHGQLEQLFRVQRRGTIEFLETFVRFLPGGHGRVLGSIVCCGSPGSWKGRCGRGFGLPSPTDCEDVRHLMNARSRISPLRRCAARTSRT
jgi:hypothetical protein